jgi:predicted glutamine amidotransferase
MCGLAGVLSSEYLTTKERKAFIELGMLSFFRGVDSTGMAIVSKKKPKSPNITVTTKKSTDHPIDFYRDPSVLTEIHKAKVMCIMAHSRAATIGDINITNAQPIETDGLVGCHNGTVRKYAPLKVMEDKETDSLNFYNAIVKDGIDKAVDSLNIGDAFALTYIVDNKLYVVRNHHRPLWMCTTKDGCIFWASEKPMLTFALERADLEIDSYTELKTDELLIYDFNSHEIDSRPLVRAPIIPRTAHGTTSSPYAPWRNDNNVVSFTQKDKRYSYMEDWMESTKGKRVCTFPEPKATTVLDSAYKMRDNRGKPAWVSQEEGEDALGEGCVECGCTYTVDDVVWWFDPATYLCDHCYSQPHVKMMHSGLDLFIKSDFISSNTFSRYGG